MTTILDVADLHELVATACQILYRLGLVDYLGHVSARIPGTDRVLINARRSTGVAGLDSITPESVVEVGLDGKLIEGPEGPPQEVFIHTEIYRARPDVLSVVHTHQPTATLLGIVGQQILPILHIEAPLVARPVPTWPCAMLVVTPELGQQLAQSLGDHQICHLQGHGIVSVAAAVQDATINAIFLERLAEANERATRLGKTPRVIPPEEIDQLARYRAPLNGRWRYYTALARRTLQASVGPPRL